MRLWEFALAFAVVGAVIIACFWTTNYRYEHVIDGNGVTCYFDAWTPGIKCFEHETVVGMLDEVSA